MTLLTEQPSRNDKKKSEPAVTDAPSVRSRSKSKQQHPAEVVKPLSSGGGDRDQERGRVRLGSHDHHLDRDEVTIVLSLIKHDKLGCRLGELALAHSARAEIKQC